MKVGVERSEEMSDLLGRKMNGEGEGESKA